MKAKNKNKNFLSLLRGRNKKKNKDTIEVIKIFVISSLIVSVISIFLSYLDHKLLIDSSKERDGEQSVIRGYTSIIGMAVNKMFFINEANAATTGNYKAINLNTSANTNITVQKGKNFTVTLKFKNDSIYVWRQAGTNIMTLNVKGNKTSIFKKSNIISNLSESIVRKGETGTFKFTLTAPSTVGKYTETYQMYVKSFNEFVNGSEIKITVNVVDNNSTSSAANTQTSSGDNIIKVEDISYISADKDVEILDKKTNQVIVAIPANEKVNIYFNQITKQYIVAKNGLIIASLNNEIIINNKNNANIDFGSKKYTSSKIVLNSNFDTVKNNTVVCATSGCDSSQQAIQVPIVDTNNIGNNTSNNINSGSYAIRNYTYASIPNEYKIRVGIEHDIFPATFTSSSGMNIYTGNGDFIIPVAQGEQVIINYDKVTQLYSVKKDGVLLKETPNYIKLQNNDPVNGILTIVNLEKRPYWNSTINFNAYRGDMEVRYNNTYDKVWIINELNLEDYLKGMGEASNSSSYEYLKTMAVAERTYASYQYMSKPNTSAKQYFNVFSDEYDQVYDGYNRETRQPSVVSAVNETRGIVIMYNNDIIKAFYSANAGGRTRTLSETWGGADVPYLKSVVDKYTTNDVRYGHGVGLSQVGAMRMISNDNVDYITVLRYYYTGVDLVKIY